jgi:hypothetical protein
MTGSAITATRAGSPGSIMSRGSSGAALAATFCNVSPVGIR